jgi:hypothetical protein
MIGVDVDVILVVVTRQKDEYAAGRIGRRDEVAAKVVAATNRGRDHRAVGMMRVRRWSADDAEVDVVVFPAHFTTSA